MRIDHAEGLAGHSDADVAVHALMDALLGAAGLGDIGELFPDTDPAFEGVSSVLLLERVIAWLVRSYLAGSTDSGKWLGVAAYYVATLFPLCIAIAGGIRRLVFGERGPAKPLEISQQDLSKTRF